jgi:hypothetical protein
VNPALVQRQLALAGIALVSALGALALGRSAPNTATGDEEAVQPAVSGSWYVATVGSYGPGFYGRPARCPGVVLTPKTRGIAHPVLPCGAKIVVAFRGRQIETEVVDKGPYAAGHEFDLTNGLATALGVRGVQQIRWRFVSN